MGRATNPRVGAEPLVGRHRRFARIGPGPRRQGPAARRHQRPRPLRVGRLRPHRRAARARHLRPTPGAARRVRVAGAARPRPPPPARGVGGGGGGVRVRPAHRAAAVGPAGGGHGGGRVRGDRLAAAGEHGQQFRPGVAGGGGREPDGGVRPGLSAQLRQRVLAGVGRRPVAETAEADAAGNANRRVAEPAGEGAEEGRANRAGGLRGERRAVRGERPAADGTEHGLARGVAHRPAAGAAHLRRAGVRVPAVDGRRGAGAGGRVRGAHPPSGAFTPPINCRSGRCTCRVCRAGGWSGSTGWWA